MVVEVEVGLGLVVLWCGGVSTCRGAGLGAAESSIMFLFTDSS